jgi:hypothetical protein
MAEIVEFKKSMMCKGFYYPVPDGRSCNDLPGRYVRESDYAELLEKYHDLIMQVSKKFPDETRHETAKRYIVERENSAQCGSANSALAEEVDDGAKQNGG